MQVVEVAEVAEVVEVVEKIQKDTKKISSGIDLVKAVAVLFVVCVHFFLHTGFYSQPHSTFTMLFWGSMRNVFFLCVPLFLITTGYLQSKKTASIKFYKGIIPIISSYLVISVISILFKVFYLNEKADFLYYLFSITNFSANNYAWYVSMFVGLYLLIPFLNATYNSLNRKKEKILLITILFLISSVVSFNFYHISGEKINYIFLEYWVGLYPFLYYFIGAFIKEYKDEISLKLKGKRKLFTLLLCFFVIFVQTFCIFLKYKGTSFPAVFFGEYNSVFVVISSALLFLFLFDIEIKNNFLKKLLRTISGNTLEIYLFSYIFDTIIYNNASKYFSSFSEINNYAFLFISLSFFFSYLCASMLKGIKSMKKGEKNEIRSDI